MFLEIHNQFYPLLVVENIVKDFSSLYDLLMLVRDVYKVKA